MYILLEVVYPEVGSLCGEEEVLQASNGSYEAVMQRCLNSSDSLTRWEQTLAIAFHYVLDPVLYPLCVVSRNPLQFWAYMCFPITRMSSDGTCVTAGFGVCVNCLDRDFLTLTGSSTGNGAPRDTHDVWFSASVGCELGLSKHAKPLSSGQLCLERSARS